MTTAYIDLQLQSSLFAAVSHLFQLSAAAGKIGRLKALLVTKRRYYTGCARRRQYAKEPVVLKIEILDQIKAARSALLAALDGLPDDALLRPGAVGIWSVKDILAHLTVWQSELITTLSGIERPSRVPNIANIEDLDEWNDEQYRVNARRPLDIILEDFHGVHKHLLKAIDMIDEKSLNDARRFAWMEGEPLWYLIAENGYWHEQEHADEILNWRKEQSL
jgi:hypothetical protein